MGAVAVARLHVSPSKRCAHRGGVWNIPRCNGRTPRPRVSRRCASERGGSAAGARRERGTAFFTSSIGTLRFNHSMWTPIIPHIHF